LLLLLRETNKKKSNKQIIITIKLKAFEVLEEESSFH